MRHAYQRHDADLAHQTPESHLRGQLFLFHGNRHTCYVVDGYKRYQRKHDAVHAAEKSRHRRDNAAQYDLDEFCELIHFHSSYSSPRSMIRSVIDPFGFTIGITSSSFSMINSMIVGPSVFAFAFSNAGIISSFLKTLIPCAP